MPKKPIYYRGMTATAKRLSRLINDHKFDEADQLLAEIPSRDAIDAIFEIAVHPFSCAYVAELRAWALHRGSLFAEVAK